MKRILISFFVLLAMSLAALAQQFSIRQSDAENYPQVVVGIDIPGEAEVQKTDFKVRELGEEVDFVFSKDMAPGAGGRAVCFLIEASGYTHGTPVENFKKAVTVAMDQLGAGDKVNICYFGKANADGRSLNTLSAEFTGDKATLAGELKNKVSAARDTNYVADVFKSIYECLDFINSKSDLPQNKVLIVLSAAINNSRSPIKADDCIEKANKFTIPIYTVTYKTGNRYAADNFIRLSDKTGGQSRSAKTSGEITSVIGDFLSAAGQTEAGTEGAFTIEFTTAQSGATNEFEIEFKGEKQTGTFAIPEGKLTFWQEFMMTIIVVIVVLVLVLAVGVWFFFHLRKKKRAEILRLKDLQEKNAQLQQQVSPSKDDKTKVGVREPQKFDLKRTQIGGGGGTPMLMVSAGNFSKNFPLNKPTLTIGRNAGNDIMIPEQTVSGNHATLVNEGGNWFILDNNSTNGTFVNGARVTKQRIAPNDMVKLGAAFLKVQL